MIAREDASGQLALEAYAIAATTPAPTPSALRERLHAHLPEYMVPAHVVVLDSFPLTSNGKIDRARLPQPGQDRRAEGAYVPPGSELEAWIAEIWRQELNVASVGVHDNFFDVGGNSLKLVQVHRRLEERFRDRISVVDLFSYPTIRALVEFLDDQSDRETTINRSRRRAELRKEAQSRRLGRAT